MLRPLPRLQGGACGWAPGQKVINKRKELLELLKERIYRFAEFHVGK